jgi:hypothetical protein
MPEIGTYHTFSGHPRESMLSSPTQFHLLAAFVPYTNKESPLHYPQRVTEEQNIGKVWESMKLI